jgi:hypothetical protein
VCFVYTSNLCRSCVVISCWGRRTALHHNFGVVVAASGVVMFRSLLGGLVLAACTLSSFAELSGSAETVDAQSNARVLPMTFALFNEGPADVCGTKCRQLVAASGMITADTPRQFLAFMRDNPAQSATVALESDGGSVLGALEFGRAIRRLGLSTTVGRVIDRRPKNGARYGELNSRVDCQSMCTFVLLAGVKRSVPVDAQVLVHQIWLGDRREDAVAANYTAEDLVVVQRDIGSIVQYTVEMGGDIELVQLSLKVPPWEPMRVLSRDELRRTRLDLSEQITEKPTVTKTAAGPATAQDLRSAVNERGWMLDSRGGHAVLRRTHPLTVEGERIGNFDLAFTCAETPGSYNLTYKELRYGPADRDLPRTIAQIELILDDQVQELKIGASERRLQRGELESVASTVVPVRMIRAFAGESPASMVLATESAGNPQTTIRVGNAGFAGNFTRLESECQQGQWGRADARAQAQPVRPEKSAQAGLKTP